MYDLAFLEIKEKTSEKKVIVTVEFFFFVFFAISWAAARAYGGTQARG